MNKINLFKVHIPPEVDKPLLDVLHSGYVGQGPKVEEFERLVAEKFNNPYVLTVNSGTSALQLALRLANCEKEDEVISTPMTCSATNEPILASGAKIVWADINPDNGLIDPSDIEKKVTPKTKAIMLVDWGGTPCDLDPIMEVAKKYNLKVIEDAAHAQLASYKGRKIGTVADFTCFSLQAIKHVTTVDGGLLFVKTEEDYKRGKLLRWYGIDREAPSKEFRGEVDIPEWGYKFHMNDVAATIGIVQMDHIDRIVNAHRFNAKYFDENLIDTYIKPKVNYEVESSYWLYTILLPSNELREKFKEFMANEDIVVSQVHWRNDHHSTFKKLAKSVKLPGVDKFTERMICIPVHWGLTIYDRQRIVDACNRFILQNDINSSSS